jgi:phage terminase large subunit-like protein
MPDLLKIQASLPEYLAAIRIETDGPPTPWAKVADDWQRRDIEAIAPALETLVRADAPAASVRRAWWVRPRGHAKTADAAMLVARVLAFSSRRRRGVWCAADQEQGIEGLDSIATLCRHNPWLDQLLTVRTNKVENERTGSVVYFTTSDVGSAYGWKDCDLFILDECTHWGTKGENLWAAMYSTAGKRKSAVVLALMNAGHGDTWQRRLRDTAAADPNWAFSELPDAVASWISPEQLADQAKYLPRLAFDRLFRNLWCDTVGDALEVADIQKCVTLSAPPSIEEGWVFVGGVDIGIARDSSAMVVLGKHVGHSTQTTKERTVPRHVRLLEELGVLDTPPDDAEWSYTLGTGQLRLAHVVAWRPAGGSQVDIGEVEAAIIEANRRFNLAVVGYDPSQAEYMGQRLRKIGVPAQSIPPGPKFQQASASELLQAFKEKRIDLYRDPTLLADLRTLRIKETQYGYRLIAPKTKDDVATGHADTASALQIALFCARRAESSNAAHVGSLVLSS